MTVTLPLKEMSVVEKLQTMESIWNDLRQDPDSVPIPDWHQEILEQRLQGEKEGKEKFIDWDDAKKQIRDAIK